MKYLRSFTLIAAFFALLFSANSFARQHKERGPVTTPGQFDYYVLSLSWSPEYCEGKGNPNEQQCTIPHAFVVHGLWPQFEQGWPDRCGKGEYVEDDLIDKVLAQNLMPSKKLLLHEWQKHGVCSGLSAENYFGAIANLVQTVRIPSNYSRLGDYQNTSVAEIEKNFIAVNPTLKADGISVACGGRYLQEVRVCLTKDLKPRSCAADTQDRCGNSVLLKPVKSYKRRQYN